MKREVALIREVIFAEYVRRAPKRLVFSLLGKRATKLSSQHNATCGIDAECSKNLLMYRILFEYADENKSVFHREYKERTGRCTKEKRPQIPDVSHNARKSKKEAIKNGS